MTGPQHAINDIALDVLAQEGDEWHGDHKLVLVRSINEGKFEAELLPFSSDLHPLRALEGMPPCPPMVVAIGLVAYGWAADRATAEAAGHSSLASDRQRVRLVHLIDRKGGQYAVAHLQDGSTVDEVGVGAVPDALRAALGLPPGP